MVIILDISLLIFVAMIAVFAYRGYGHGLIEALSRVGGMAAGYAVAIMASPYLAAWLVANTQLSGLLAFVLAPPLLVMSTFWLVGLVFDAVEQLYGHKVEDTRISHYGGIIVGGLLGVFLAILSVWSYVLVRDTLVTSNYQEYSQRQPSQIELGVAGAVGGASSLAMGRFNLHGHSAIRAANFMAQPARVIRQAQALWLNPYMRYLYRSELVSQIFARADLTALKRERAFQELLQDGSVQSLLLNMQLIDDSEDYSEALAKRLLLLWRWLEAVKDEPEVAVIINDPDFQAALKSKNPTGLLLNPQLLELFRRAVSDRDENAALLSPQSQVD